MRATKIGVWEWDMRTNKAYWSEENYRVLGLDLPLQLASRFRGRLHITLTRHWIIRLEETAGATAHDRNGAIAPDAKDIVGYRLENGLLFRPALRKPASVYFRR